MDHPYIERKQVDIYKGVKQEGDRIIIPVTYDGCITSLQFINADGSKKFMTGGRVKGCYFEIAGDNNTIYIAEGYATGASIAMATGKHVFIAFSAHNLYETTSKAKELFPDARIVLCGDNDQACKTKADQIESTLKVSSLFPDEKYNDFNDWHCGEGLEVLKDFFGKKPKTYRNNERYEVHKPQAFGVLCTIMDYYNATSGNDQPHFAMQSALATCSILLSRNFQTNFNNRTSLFLMNVAKSGTGKEHAKRIVERILEATNNEHLIGGDGYTSGSAVLSTLQVAPRHITVIDEFSKYLQAANNKNASSHLMEANTRLMEAIGRNDGIMRNKAFSMVGMTQEKKELLMNQAVINPAITLMAMTTPDDLFKNIDIGAIKDGFLNRFVVCVSDAQREKRKHREMIDVPQSIIDWSNAINERLGEDIEMYNQAPNVQTINFTLKAMEVQDSFQDYCIDKQNDLEIVSLSEVPGRSNEMAMRIALIMALAENPNATKIEEHHMQAAVDWVKYNLERLIIHLKTYISASDYEGYKKEILKDIRLRGERGVTWAEMQKQNPYSKHKKKDLEEMIQALIDAELIEQVEPIKRGSGRPSKTWIATK